MKSTLYCQKLSAQYSFILTRLLHFIDCVEIRIAKSLRICKHMVHNAIVFVLRVCHVCDI